MNLITTYLSYDRLLVSSILISKTKRAHGIVWLVVGYGILTFLCWWSWEPWRSRRTTVSGTAPRPSTVSLTSRRPGACRSRRLLLPGDSEVPGRLWFSESALHRIQNANNTADRCSFMYKLRHCAVNLYDFGFYLVVVGWLGSRVVSVLDSGAKSPGSTRSRDAVG